MNNLLVSRESPNIPRTSEFNLDRFEYKYLLNFSQYAALALRLRELCRKDSHAGTHGRYPVFSKYYDTLDFRFWREKIDGEYRHAKVRLRTYDTTFNTKQSVFLEGKFKEYDRQKKVRIPVPTAFTKCIRPADLGNYRQIAGSDILEKVLGDETLYPACHVYYEREAFFLNLGEREYRLNFDSQICYLTRSEGQVRRQHVEERQIYPDGHVVMEVKGPSALVPDAIKNELKSIGAKRITFSKYISAMARLGQDFGHSGVVE